MTMYNHETKVPRQKGIKHYIYGTRKQDKKQPMPLQRLATMLATPSRIERPPSNLANLWYPVSPDEEDRRKVNACPKHSRFPRRYQPCKRHVHIWT
jgi:hypothetical protein